MHPLLAEALSGDVRITIRETTTTTPDPTAAASFTGQITFNGATLTARAGASSLSGFLPNTTLRMGGTPYDGEYTIASVTATAITLTATLFATADVRAGVALAGLGTLDEDLDLLDDGSAHFVENACRAPWSRSRRGLTGAVLLRVGDDVTTTCNSEILAGRGDIDVYGDWSNGDPHFGTTMVVRGTVTPGAGFLARFWGQTDVDTFQFGETGGVAGGTTVDSPGYILLGGKARVFGDLGEDRFTAYYLQTMNVAAGHTLTLDGQAGSDRYAIYTTGTQGSQRNYVINLLDTGAAADGVDEAEIYGRDTTYATPAPAGTKYEADDIFLLRAAQSIPDRNRPTAPGYVALLAGRGGAPAEQRRQLRRRQRPRLLSRHDHRQRAEPVRPADQLIDTALNGRLTVYGGGGGNDAFFTDDTTRDHHARRRRGRRQLPDRPDLRLEARRHRRRPGAADVFPVLIAMDPRLAEPGHAGAAGAQGGSGNDEFVVYSNQAELRLEGDDGNDSFIVRAFALAAVVDTDTNVDGLLNLADVDDLYGTNPDAAGVCRSPLDPNRPLNASRPRRDTNGDGVCNAATRTPRPLPGSGRTIRSRWTPPASLAPRSASASTARRRHPRRRRRGRGVLQHQRAGLTRRRRGL